MKKDNIQIDEMPKLVKASFIIIMLVMSGILIIENGFFIYGENSLLSQAIRIVEYNIFLDLYGKVSVVNGISFSANEVMLLCLQYTLLIIVICYAFCKLIEKEIRGKENEKKN